VHFEMAPKTSCGPGANEAKTGKADSRRDLNDTGEKVNPDGTRTATLGGTLPLGKGSEMVSYPVPEPTQFAATVFTEALREKGVDIKLRVVGGAPDFMANDASIKTENLVGATMRTP